MDPFAPIDLDAEAISLDGTWYTRDELAALIKRMIESGDFKLARPSEALEQLEAALRESNVLSVRVPNDLAAGLARAAQQAGKPVGHLLREAVAYYLAAAAAARPGPEAPAEAGASEKAVEATFFGEKLGG
jgi:hypothetical protein